MKKAINRKNKKSKKHSRKWLPWVATLGILAIGASVATPLAMCAFRPAETPFVEVFSDDLKVDTNSTTNKVGEFYLPDIIETPTAKILAFDGTELPTTVSLIVNSIPETLGKYSIDLKSTKNLTKTEVKIVVYVAGQICQESKFFFITVSGFEAEILINGLTTKEGYIDDKITDAATITLINTLPSDITVSLVTGTGASIDGSSCDFVKKTNITTADYLVSISCTKPLTNQVSKIVVSHDSKILCESVELDISFVEDPSPKVTFREYPSTITPYENQTTLALGLSYKNISSWKSITWSFDCPLFSNFITKIEVYPLEPDFYGLVCETSFLPLNTTSIEGTLKAVYEGVSVLDKKLNFAVAPYLINVSIPNEITVVAESTTILGNMSYSSWVRTDFNFTFACYNKDTVLTDLTINRNYSAIIPGAFELDIIHKPITSKYDVQFYFEIFYDSNLIYISEQILMHVVPKTTL